MDPEVGALARRRFLESQGHADRASVEAWLRLAMRAVRSLEITHWFTRPDGHTFDFVRQLSRVRCPTLVGGEDDPMTPIECQADIAAALQAHLVRFERVAGCGHAVVPDASERAMAAIRDFIAPDRSHGGVRQSGRTPLYSPRIQRNISA